MKLEIGDKVKLRKDNGINDNNIYTIKAIYNNCWVSVEENRCASFHISLLEKKGENKDDI